MQVIHSLYNLARRFLQGCVVTIGNFDGVHRGHQQLLSLVQEKSRILKLPAVVILFEPQPVEYFNKSSCISSVLSSRDHSLSSSCGLTAGSNSYRLTGLREKIMSLIAYEIDSVLLLTFNKRLARMSAQQFISEILVNKLHTKCLLVGDDFVCGKEREGDFTMLQRVGGENGFQVIRMETLRVNGERVSSSLIRDVLAQGECDLVSHFLGHLYQVYGRVIRGNGLGHKLGFPTANISLGRRELPFTGVYLVKVYGISFAPLWGLANVGCRPTVSGVSGRKIFEIHILDFSKDIYRKRLMIEFYQKKRDEQKFNSLEELRLQIVEDVRWAKIQSKQIGFL